MFGGLGNLTEMLKNAKQLQGNLAKMQEEMAAKRFDGVAGGEMVRATVDGKGTLLDLKIDPKATEDVELLEDLVRAAVCAATTKSQEAVKEQMSSLAGGMDLGGLSQMLGGGS